MLITTAAMHQVEKCEEDPELSFRVNALGTRNLALAAQSTGSQFVFFSTDYVFDGKKQKPYVETDAGRPLNVYGNTKLSGENFALTVCPRSYVVRVSGLYGNSECRQKRSLNFVKLMMKLGKEREFVRVVDNEILSPTWTQEIAQQLERLVKTESFGLYHMVSEGQCSWHAFAKEIFRLSNATARLEVADPNEFKGKVARPEFSALDNENLNKLNLNQMSDWKDALKKYIGQL